MRRCDFRMLYRDAAHMQFENDCFFPRDLRPAILPPGECGLDDPALWDVTRIVAPVKGQILPETADPVAEDSVAPAQPPLEGFGVRVEQQLVGIETVPV